MDLSKLLGELLTAILDEPKPARRPQQQNSRRTARKPAAKVSRSNQIYGEQTILTTASRLPMPIPYRLRQMRTLSGITANGTRSMESLFVQQGRFMADFTDDFPHSVPCTRRVPMYYNLSMEELRCYFTWRTQYRAGSIPAIDGPYLLLYCSELINQIGVSSPEEGYDRLLKVCDDYAVLCPETVKRITRWSADYAAFYRLPFRNTDAKTAALTVILRHTLHTAAELTEALDTVSKYHILTSKLYAAHPAETAGAVQAVWQQLLLHYAQIKGESLPGFLLGGRSRRSHTMFEGAVFYQPDRMLTREAYRLNPVYIYHCYHGQWALERFCGEPDGARIGALLRTVDSVLRETLKFKSKLKPGDLPDGDTDVIRRAVLGFLEAEKRKNLPKIELNAEELEAIRAAAEHTTDMLTLPEETEPELPAAAVPDEPFPEEAAAAPAPEPAPGETLPEIPDVTLSRPALTLLLCLLTGQSWQPLVDAGQMLSVLTDEINEAFYDRFGDTVLDTDETGAPVLIDDYAEELRQLFTSE